MMQKGTILPILFTLMIGFKSYCAESPTLFTPETIFNGNSEGNGYLKLLFKKKQAFHVQSQGYKLDDGTFRLDQTITFQGKTAQKRHWILKTINANNYTGTLSDASGSVTGQTNGSGLTLKYRIKGPLIMQQTLELKSDGKTIDNIGKITVFGIRVGTLHETIIRKD